MTKKLTKCPDCGEPLGSDCWVAGRKLQQSCYECGWEGEPRIPEPLEIKSTKEVQVNMFYGFCYEIFDKYGHLLTSSRTYDTEGEAIQALRDNLTRDNKSIDIAPCTAVLWPKKVTVKGKVFN
jgi:hypothetical protein